MRRLTLLASLVVPLLTFAQTAAPLIPRDVLLGNPEKARARISPDGKKLAWLQPDKKNVLQVFVRTIGQTDEQMVTDDKKRGIRQYNFTADSTGILYGQDADGDENFHVFHVDLASKNVRDLTPFQGVRGEVVDIHPKFKDTVLVSLNLRDRKVFDVYKVSLKTGAVELDTQNPGDVAGWSTDANMVVRGASITTPEGGTEIRVRDSAKSPWRSLIKVGAEENVGLDAFTLDGKSVFLETSVDSDTARLVEKNLKSGTERVIAKSDKSDVGRVMIHPTKYSVQAVEFDVDGRNAWTFVDSSFKADFEGIAKLAEGDIVVEARDDADQNWVVSITSDKAPTKSYLWERAAKKGTFLFSMQPKLDGLTLAEMKPATVTARDGLVLPVYLTTPAGVAAKNLPTVLLVHGGPWGRDTWGYSGLVQLLANRGYAVLQVNFRASTGFGKKFLNAGNRQWGLTMHDDLIDSVKWAVAQGVADPKKVCIMGGSYGGYAALAGAAFTPDQFKCSVDIVGPSNISTLLKTVPPYWAPMKAMFAKRVGDIDDPKDAEMLKKASPLFSADKIRIPLLIGQGANDPRVKQAESEQIVAAMEKNGLPVTYVVYPDEGHGFARPENRTDFFARAEAFLAQNLGGRVEPLPADGKVAGSTGVVKVVKAKAAAK